MIDRDRTSSSRQPRDEVCTSSVPSCVNDTDVTREIADPTAALHTNATFAGERGWRWRRIATAAGRHARAGTIGGIGESLSPAKIPGCRGPCHSS